MIYRLLLNNSSLAIAIKKEGDDQGDYYILLSERDPGEEVNFRPGFCYFNPLIKKMPRNQLYVVNGDGVMININNGKPPPKLNRSESEISSRGWFEIPPCSLTIDDISPEVRQLIRLTPKLTWVIAQVARTTMGLRIPENLNAPGTDAWVAWITGQRMPLSPRAMRAFNALSKGATGLEVNQGILEEFETGRVPEKQYVVKLRWAQIKEITIAMREMRESIEWDMVLPESVLKEGYDAILRAALERFGKDWQKIFPDTVAVDELSRVETADSTIEGALIWYRPSNGGAFTPFLYKEQKLPEKRPRTINDIFQQALIDYN